MPKGIPRQVHVAIVAPVRETSDAQLFAQSAHAPDQTESRPRLLHCPTDLTAPASAMMPVFHEVSRAGRPSQQSRIITAGSGLRTRGLTRLAWISGKERRKFMSVSGLAPRDSGGRGLFHLAN